MKKIIDSLPGMHDLLPAQLADWRKLEAAVATTMAGYGYAEIRTPLLERKALFIKPVGQHSDIVGKELYSFVDKNEDTLCLRPEATVPTLRALANGDLLNSATTAKVWYCGPMFRRERPQKGRYRQFHQFGAEAVGSASPQIDAELILLCARLWRTLGIADQLQLELNNLGNASERANYRKLLQTFLHDHFDDLDEDAKQRVDTNPLRVLDSKNETTLKVLARAPLLSEALGQQSVEHVAQVTEMLKANGIKPNIQPRLVRGLDYYNLTVFEWTPIGNDSRQGTLAGGGRYDGLAEMLGAKPTPACGFAAGIERLVALATKQTHVTPDIYFVVANNALTQAYTLSLCEQLREAGLTVVTDERSGKIGSLFKRADKIGAQIIAMVGNQEAADNSVTLKHLRKKIPQQTVDYSQLLTSIQQMLNRTN